MKTYSSSLGKAALVTHGVHVPWEGPGRARQRSPENLEWALTRR